MAMTQHDFSNKTFAVTGTSGMGLEAALYMARQGASVYLAGIDPELNKQAAAKSQSEGLSVKVATVDVSDENSVGAWVADIAGQTSQLHALVNAAAIQTYGTVESTTTELWDKTIAVNLRSCFLTSHGFYPLLKAADGAAIVHVASVQGFSNQNKVLAYATTKGAIHAMTRAMAVDCAADGIRVNSVSPGSIRTPMLEYSASQLAVDGTSVEDMIAEFGRAHPAGRVGTTAETSALIAFLCSDAAPFITGADMLIDGGLSAHLGV